ncbi:response regulator [Gorillibacterium sp. sgz5001074]|uniref:response regulator n=1 Tax=Gorillibacterium sp. sgz5001074 TaxID=3446695 RepID=UPI003F675AAA
MEKRSDMKLCVIDDIKSVVDMISLKIPWADHGIQVAGTALDGEEGLRLVQEVQPDIVLTDIRMPRMDGLEMTRAVLATNPECRIVILSAYTDFSYAQQAIRLGAFDFVKKPFSVEEIVQAVLKAKAACEEAQQESEKVREMERKIRQSLPVLRQEYLTLLLHHRTDGGVARRRWEFLEIGLEPSGLCVLLVEIDRFMEKYMDLPVQEIELIRFSLQNILEETLSAGGARLVFREAAHRYVAVLNVTGEEQAVDLAEACRANVERYTKFTVSIGAGLPAVGIEDLPRSYQQALAALSYHFYTEGNGVFGYGEIPAERKGLAPYGLASEQELLFAVRSGNGEKSIQLLDELLDGLVTAEPRPEPKVVESVIFELASKLFRALLEQFPYEEVRHLEEPVAALRSKEHPTLTELRRMLTGLCREGCRFIERERSSESTKIIHRSKDYIRTHLHLDLSLEHCARQVNLSPGYYSNLFRKVLGISFQQFVIQEKMEKAKSMLIGDYQVQEIATELGYEHRRYFSEIFKKYTGQTPSEFKQSYTGKPE